MVAIMNNGPFEKSKQFFKNGDITSTLENYEKAISHVDKSKDKSEYFSFLKNILKHCEENNLIEEEALVLRAMARTYSAFKMHAEAMKYHWASLKLQKKLGKKKDVAEGLLFLAEDLEISGNYDDCIKTFEESASIFKELGKLRKVKEINKEISRLKEFSKGIIEDEYYLHKFNVDKY